MDKEAIQKLLYNIYVKNPKNMFMEFMEECEKINIKRKQKTITLNDIKNKNNKKIKGDMFELFCVLYLKYVKKYFNVWLLKDTPNDIIEMLSLTKKDMGIDIIAELNGNFYAVQCKYKHNTSSCLSWTCLSTFYALCSKTGPWEKIIVMTTCNSVNQQGLTTEKDLLFCLTSFKNITEEDWLKMCIIHKCLVKEIKSRSTA